ncbi:hypothetical protein MMU07_03450 [Aquiflexum sp. LQ15W]|uniref:hypothetical protein n=1 Tax=Cognataquiflexum nitidum TaxID=2922272 RepID=UPI001F147D77|nr:hypothetical protein [Cognataquiflexum nitidum]MCH6198621.1 hypothetical protein [Cognataquiflexum nitidum]
MNWIFAKHTDYLDNHGFKDNEIVKFGRDTAKSLVREAIQNSCDALDVEKHSTVKVVIKQGRISKGQLLNFSQIEDHIKNCLHKSNDPSENAEIQRHIDAFERDGYRYIEISDYNTTGMGLNAFEGFTQGVYKSSQKVAGSQGSKGVGKAAYYASSYLRTMLISTKSDEGLRFRGIAKLSNHKDPEDENGKLNYKGFYGDLATKEEDEIPEGFIRTENGTSIFIIGLWNLDDLESEIIKEVLRNYWFAIYKDQLHVNVNDTELRSHNLGDFITTYFTDFKDYVRGGNQNPRPFFETVEKGKQFEKEIRNIGTCHLWLHQDPLFQLGAVARFRKTKMLIYKEKNLDMGYAGVFLCDNEEGNIFLKEIENEAHDIWNEKENPLYTTRARVTLQEIKEFILQKYKEFAGLNDSTAFTIDTIDDLFNFSSSKGQSINKKAPIKRPQPLPGEETKERIIDKAIFKAFNENGNIYYRLTLFSSVSKKGQKFKVSMGTDSSKEEVKILESGKGIPAGSFITLDIQKGENVIDKIRLDSPFLVAPSIISVSN